jgi:UDP-glucose 4-epimerase
MTHGKVLVTGASGFIGSAIVKHLARSGVPVLATARRQCGLLAQELSMPVYELDVMGDLVPTDNLFAEADTLVHCATPNDIQSSADDGGFPLGVTGTYRLLEYAAHLGVRRVIYLSTLQVYGRELEGAVSEATPVRCENPYGLNHYLGEEVCRLAALRHNIDVVSLRPSNVYGVPSVSTVERTTLVPMCFVKNALATGAVELRSSGLQRRNFVSTDEVAEIISVLIDDFPQGYNVINAVSGWHASIIDVVRMVQTVWKDTNDKNLDLRILSAEPTAGNAFTVTSGFVTPRRTLLQSQHHMNRVIQDLIVKFQSA